MLPCSCSINDLFIYICLFAQIRKLEIVIEAQSWGWIVWFTPKTLRGPKCEVGYFNPNVNQLQEMAGRERERSSYRGRSFERSSSHSRDRRQAGSHVHSPGRSQPSSRGYDRQSPIIFVPGIGRIKANPGNLEETRKGLRRAIWEEFIPLHRKASWKF